MLKTYKYRIYPNKKQEEYLINTFGCVRFIYNKMLADKIKYYKKSGRVLKNTYIKYKKEFKWLKEIDQLALLNTQQNLEKDFENFFTNKSVDFPKFKTKKSNYYTYTTNNQNENIYIQGKYIKIPKLKSMIKIKCHREFNGSIKSCTISKDESDKYFISLLVDVEKEILPKVNKKIGVDVGLKEFAVCSDGYRVKMPEYLIKSERKLNRLEKELLRKQKGSKNRDKTILKIKKMKNKIANQRKDLLHKISTKLIRENQSIAIEDLRIINTVKNHEEKAISEVTWYEFRKMLEYKANLYGRNIVVAPSNYASSQLCSVCGYKNSDVKKLALRKWTCPKCGTTHDRDINASLNLEKLIK